MSLSASFSITRFHVIGNRSKPRVKSLAELNAWLADQCIAYAKRTKHKEFKERTIWEVFQSMFLKKLLGFFDQNMLPLFEFERFLFDQMIPSDREALKTSGRA